MNETLWNFSTKWHRLHDSEWPMCFIYQRTEVHKSSLNRTGNDRNTLEQLGLLA